MLKEIYGGIMALYLFIMLVNWKAFEFKEKR